MSEGPLYITRPADRIGSIVKCQTTRMHEDCQNEATTEVTMLHGNKVMLCDRCAKYMQICSEILEPIDREIIRNLQELSKCYKSYQNP